MNISEFTSRDTFSSLEVIERIEELEEMGAERDKFDDEELEQLSEFASEAESYCSGWEDGVELINAEYFVDYIRGQIEALHEVDFDRSPFTYIDWDAVADDESYDYDEVTLGYTIFYISNV